MAGGRRTQDVNVPMLLTVGIISAILLVVIIVGVEAWFRDQVRMENQTKVFAYHDPAVTARVTPQPALNQVRWADKDHHWVTIPIDQAMAAIVKESATPGTQ